MKQVEVHILDLRKMDGEGDIPCPKCGTMLSPNDTSEENYTVIDVRTNDEGMMEELAVQCLKCGAEIRLVGFIDLKETW